MSAVAIDIAADIGFWFGEDILRFLASKRGRPLKILLGYGIYHALNFMAARQVYDLDQQLGKKPESSNQKLAAIFLPSWHNAFTIGKYATNKTPGTAWLHTLGQLLVPSSYTAYQLANLKQRVSKPTKQNAWATLLLPSLNTYGMAKELNEDPKKLNLLSQALVTSGKLPAPQLEQPFMSIDQSRQQTIHNSLIFPSKF